MLSSTCYKRTFNLISYFQECIPNFCIDEKMLKALCFRERLEVYPKNNSSVKPEPIGKYLITVESIGPRNQEFFVHVFLSVTIDSHPIVSRITSSATKEFHCLEEKKYELSTTVNNSFCEKKIYIRNEDNSYFLKIIKKSVNDSQLKTNWISHSDKIIISDACSILLMRYLAMTDFQGILNFDLITIEGNIIKCDYECSTTDVTINNTDMNVFVVVQTFYINHTINNVTKTFLTKEGNILNIDLTNFPYNIRVNSHVNYCVHHQEPIILPLREQWKEDLELNSKYFYKKICQEEKKRNYLLLHLEINDLLMDYIQRLLCNKPNDVLKFTINHFKHYFEL